MDVLCVGFGFVGKAYALFLKELGHNVCVLTANDKTKDEAKGYGFSEPMEIIDFGFDVAVIAVPTPTINNKQDLSILSSILNEINKKYTIKNIVIKSTVLPGEIIKLEKKYKNKYQNFYFYPEFLEAKNPIGGVFNQTCCVFGKTGNWLQEEKWFLSQLFGIELEKITFTNLTTACMLKYIHNMWLSCNISFWNSMIRCTKLHNVDYDLVLKETHKSKYFGPHPWHIGTAYGGECLPKDIKAFVSSIESNGVFKKFIQVIDEVNEEVKK